MGNSSSTNRLNAIYILLTLKNYSDTQHPMSITDITAKGNRNYYQTFSDDTSINASTVSRTLDILCTDTNLAFENIPMDFF